MLLTNMVMATDRIKPEGTFILSTIADINPQPVEAGQYLSSAALGA
jgi:hypothetical protein